MSSPSAAEGLFPKPAEIKMKCSCPDWAGMCKHVAAVMYGVGARLDDKPELLFLLRKVDHLELIAGAVDSAPVADAGKSRGKKTIAAGDLADVFGIEMAEAETPTEAAPAIAKTPAKSRVPASKTVSKKKPNRAVIDSKKSAGAAAANRKRPKTATARPDCSTAGAAPNPRRASGSSKQCRDRAATCRQTRPFRAARPPRGMAIVFLRRS